MLARSQYEQIATLHAEAIDQGFLPTLGTSFLALMYQAIDESTQSVLLVDERDGKIVGFVSGGIGMGPIYRRLLSHPIRLISGLLPSLIRPNRWRRIAEILRHTSRKPNGLDLPRAELMSLAVSSDWRGKGVADGLYNRLRQSFAATDISEFKIIVGQTLQPALRFYRRMGAEPVCETEVHRGKSSVILTHRI